MNQSTDPIKKSIKDLPKKPQRSSNYKNIGYEIPLVSNHYKINLEKVFSTVHIYDIIINDSENQLIHQDNRKLRNEILKSIEKKLKEKITRYYISGFNIWAFAKDDQLVYDTTLGTKSYHVQIKWLDQIQLKDLLYKDDLGLQLRQILNVVVKNYLKDLGFIDIGQDLKYYNKKNKDDNVLNSNNLKVWYGFKTAFDILQRVPVLLIDFSSRVLRNETALARINKLSKDRYNKQEIEDIMKETSVMSNYGNYKIYRIHAIDYAKKVDSKFEKKGVSITYREYFKQQYGLQIKDKDQPLLRHDKKTWINDPQNNNARKKIIEPIYLVPELCNMTGITDEERNSRNMMTDLAQFTKVSPVERMKIISNLATPIGIKFKNDGFALQKFDQLKGILLNPPAIILGKNQSMKPKDGNFMIRDCIYDPVTLKIFTKQKDWIFVYSKFNSSDDEKVDDFIAMLKQASNTFGIKITEPYFIVMSGFKPEQWCQEIQEEVKKSKPQIIVTWISEKQKGMYKDFKKLCYEKIGVPHQNILSNKYENSKNKMSHASKIILQINAKLGKPLWVMEPIKEMSKRTMIVGIDVYHKTIAGKNSCAAFIASMDDKFSKFYSSTMIQGVGQEIMKSVSIHMEKAIRCYLLQNKVLPETIILYRDGVGESQVLDILNIEVAQIKQIFKKIDPAYNPQFAEIVVIKRINHRFFSAKGDNYLNPQSGTLVNDFVVHDYHEFFLIPQNVTQGTATPTQYKVIENSTKLSSDAIEQFTFHQCFNYANWCGAVRVPAPVQYAHKLAYLIGDTFQRDINQNLVQTLCYL